MDDFAALAVGAVRVACWRAVRALAKKKRVKLEIAVGNIACVCNHKNREKGRWQRFNNVDVKLVAFLPMESSQVLQPYAYVERSDACRKVAGRACARRNGAQATKLQSSTTHAVSF